MKKKKNPKEQEYEKTTCVKCGAANVKLYQYDLCKDCLLEEFKEIKLDFIKEGISIYV
jgi:NMD protein affecting ribosome stability and mRNA decay